jgi:hypothetical protein
VLVVIDAIQCLNAEDSRRALAEIQAAGGQLVTADSVTGPATGSPLEAAK